MIILRESNIFNELQVEEGDGLPAYICLPCNRLLDVSYCFKCQIQNSDVKLRQILKLQMPVVHDKNVKDTTIVKDIISDIVSCSKDNLSKQEIYSPHDIVTFDNATVQSDEIVHNESCISHELIQKTEEIAEQNEKDYAQYDMLKEDMHNANIIEVTLCDRMQTKEIHTICDQQSQISSLTTEDIGIKEEQLMFSEENISKSLTNEKQEEMLKTEIKNDLLKNFDEHNASKQNIMSNNQDTKGGINGSDDEEKPLICRTARQRCLHCIKSFATKLALQRHMTVHKHKTKLRYVCYMCDKQFSNIAKLKNHVVNSHKTDNKTIQETNQDKRANKTSTKITRNGNNLMDTTKEEKRNFKYTCKVCSKQFIYQKSFLSHAKTHPEYNEKASDDAQDQSSNKTNDHKDRTPIFKENESEEEEEEEDDDDSDLPIESLQCTQCGKLFATKRNLKRHISTHSGLKFNCSTCGKGFSRVDKLKDHEQSKHKEEIFGNIDDEDDDEEDNENKVNENSENRKKVSLLYAILHLIRLQIINYNLL